MNIFSVVQLIQLCFSQALGWDRGKWLWIPWAPWQAVLIWWSPFRARMRGATSGWCQRGPVCLTEGSVGLGTVSWRLSAPAGKVSWAVLLKALWVFLPPKMMLYCRAILIIYNGSLLSFFMKLSDFWVDCVALESLGLIELRILPGAFCSILSKRGWLTSAGCVLSLLALLPQKWDICTKSGLSLRSAALWAFRISIQLPELVPSSVFSLWSE